MNDLRKTQPHSKRSFTSQRLHSQASQPCKDLLLKRMVTEFLPIDPTTRLGLEVKYYLLGLIIISHCTDPCLYHGSAFLLGHILTIIILTF